jgi:hypothetical protein
MPRFAICTAVLILTRTTLLCQVSTGTINVEVQDSSGAVMPGASIILNHVATGQTRQGTSNERGEFQAFFMPLGRYSLTVESPGFKKKTIAGLELRVDQSARIVAVLEPGEVRELVQVTAMTPLLETDTSSLGQVIENKKILDLPLNGRNPFALGLLAGNTTPMFGMGSNLPFIGGGGRFSANEVMLDGVDNNTTVNSGSIGRTGIAYTPSVDAVQEFKVKTSTFSAEFGHSAGTVINASIKSGGNQFHGALFEFLRNDKLDANNFFTNAAGLPRATFQQNQFGGALGGPILRDRTFFFVDYQGTRQRTAAGTAIYDVPPEDFRLGDFSMLAAPIFDPATRRVGPAGTVIADPFPNNRIPASRMNPASVETTKLVPTPNFGAPGAQSRNFFRQTPRRFDADQWDLRIDHKISNNNNLFGRFSFGNQSWPSPGVFEGFIGGGSSNIDNARHLVLSDTYIFSPKVVNEFRFGYIRHNGSILGDAPQGVEFAERNRVALFPFPVKGFPSIAFNFSGAISGSQQFTSWGGGNSNLNIENRFHWADNINITRGNHTLKTGVDIRRPRFETLKGSPFFGEFVFGSIFTSSSDAPGSGAPLADFLLGFPSTIQGTQMLDWGRQREIYLGTYFQDDWKVSRNLTLNLGVRYDLYTQPVDARDRGSLFDLSMGRFALPGQDGLTRAIVDGDHNNIGPRVGFAYQLGAKLVIRGGYGIFYGLRDQNQEVTQFSGNNPNTPTLSVPTVTAGGTVSPPFTLSTPIIAAPSDTTLAAFTPDRPFVRTIRTQSFHDARIPTLQQFNLSFQYEPFATWLFEISLSAARGRNLASAFINKNQVPFEFALDGRNTQLHRPFPNINGTIPSVFSIATSSYEAANLKVEKRYSQGLNFLANYTIQKNIENNGTGPSAYTQNGGTSIVLDSHNLWRERAVAPIDVSQIFVLSYGYELPLGTGKRWFGDRGVLPQLFGGWQVNGITSLRGGFPTDIRTNRLPPVFNTFNVPDRVPGEPIQIQNKRGVDSFFNPNAFRVPGSTLSNTGAQIQLFGNAARRVARGPGSVNFDFSVFKETLIREDYRLQFRAEFFNLTNTPTFFLPSASNRTLTCIGPAGAPCNAGNEEFGKLSNGTATGRQIQFGLKLLF